MENMTKNYNYKGFGDPCFRGDEFSDVYLICSVFFFGLVREIFSSWEDSGGWGWSHPPVLPVSMFESHPKFTAPSFDFIVHLALLRKTSEALIQQYRPHEFFFGGGGINLHQVRSSKEVFDKGEMLKMSECLRLSASKAWEGLANCTKIRGNLQF